MLNSYRKLFLALCLSVISVSANARDRDHDSNWRLGYGHDSYGIYHWTGRDWRRTPGSATDVGDGWVIGTDRRSGGYGIYRWNGRTWNRVSGGAVRIGGTYEQPWVINDRGERFYWNGYDWDETRGVSRRYSRSHTENSFAEGKRRDRW